MFRIPLIKPHITDEEINAVVEVLKTRYLTEGPVTREFEKTVAEYVGAKHAVSFTSNTTGMETALRALGVGPGDEVIVPDYTYPATSSVVEIVGARTILVDIDPSTGNIDYDALEKAITPKTKVVLPVSIFGNPLDYSKLHDLKKRYGFYILEDAACSIGASFQGKKVGDGSLADISVFSFHPRKFITTGEGGMATTNDDALAEFMRSYKNFGMGFNKDRNARDFVRVGTNYKLSNVLAAIGLSQMKKIDDLLLQRKNVAERYKSLLAGESVVQLTHVVSEGEHSWQSFVILVPHRDQVLARMREKGIEVQIGTFALHLQPAYSHMQQGSLEHSRFWRESSLALPLYGSLSLEDQEFIVGCLKEILHDYN